MAERVVLAMSGGVDSSAAALLLRSAGYEVVGLFMRSGAAETVCRAPEAGLPILSAPAHKQGCCSAADAADARRVADGLDIPFHSLNFEREFGRIKDYFADEYLAGRTPNPCVMCNNWLKFGKLWTFATQIGATKIATGHYARVAAPADGIPALLRGADRAKDQSYVLFGLDLNLLRNVLFPVGDLSKPEIRSLAREAGIKTADKPDSQEICFVPDNDYAGFLARHRGESATAGELVDTAGNVLGSHSGYERFTVGQRKGLGIAVGSPRFVLRIEPDSKRVVVGTHDELGRRSLRADRVNWLADVGDVFRCTAQIRYQHRPAEATVTKRPDGFDVSFDEPQYGVAPGQACVLYDEDRVVGGGWIRRT